tara:strand:- start:16126 stop:17631 length:1506 start_codon:yes stop_codon:yes gene_type:complete
VSILLKDKKKVIIIGGGTAGLTIAYQLQDHFNIVVIEKSKYKKYPFFIYKIPLLGGLLFSKKKYISTINFNFYDRNIPFFESNFLGGASVINGCVHTIGNSTLWDYVLKPFDLSYKDVLSSFNKLYSLNENNNNKISITKTPQNIIDKAFIKALNNQKVPCGDMNFSNNEICGPILVTSGKYFRSSVLSLLDRKIFKVLTAQKVEKINFNEDGKVTGVSTDLKTINADYVISASGVIGSCDLLLKTKNIEKENKKNFLDDVSIGKDIIDHTNLRIKVIANRKFNSLNELSHSFFKKLLIVFKHFSGNSTLLKTTGASSAAYLDLDDDGEIDTKIQLLQFTESGRLGSDGSKSLFDSQPGFSIAITLINPKSRGEITLGDSKCNVNPNYLSSKKDINLLITALKYSLDLLRSEAISPYVLKIINEGEIENNPEQFIFDNIYSGYHLVGGTQDAIDKDFKVKKTENLYVCDASVFKEHVASNSHSSVIVIADIFSTKFINKNY